MRTHFTRVALLSVSLGVFACSQAACTANSEEPVDSNDSEIVGGTVVAQEGAWPGAAAVYKGSLACGGTLVAPKWVLTAAHCVTTSSTTGGFTKVIVGRNKLTGTGGESLTPDRAFRHAQYNASSHDNDIALIHLSTASTLPVANLVHASDLATITDGQISTIVGWGTTSESGSISNDLRQVDVPVISNDKCKTFPSYSHVPDNQICAVAPNGGKDSCQGDSGGPLFLKFGNDFRQVGLVSWGIGCARANAPGVYTRVGTYLDWLKTQSNGEIVVDTSTTTATTP